MRPARTLAAVPSGTTSTPSNEATNSSIRSSLWTLRRPFTTSVTVMTEMANFPCSSRYLRARSHLGYATPVGEVGLTADYSFAPEWALGAGLGIGSGLNGPSPQVAAIARLRPWHGFQDAFVTNLSYSTGGYEFFDLKLPMGGGVPGDPHDTTGADRAHWIQLDVGWERRAAGGFSIRLTTGFAVMLNPGDLRCTRSGRGARAVGGRAHPRTGACAG